jgi:hypothetical protein
MLTGFGKQLSNGIDISHHSNAMFITETFNCGRTKMADISGAENVCFALGCRVEDRIIIWIELSQRFHDDGLNQVSDFRKIAGKTHDLIGGDPVPRLNARIEQHALDLIKNEPRQYQRMSTQDRIQDAESGRGDSSPPEQGCSNQE